MKTNEIVKIAARYCGPPNSGNGGYTCGLLAEAMDGPAQVRLRRPGPLDRELRLEHGEKTILKDGPEILAEAAGTREAPPEIPLRVGFAEATESSRAYIGFKEHSFPTCFVCGPDREEGDGLRIFAGAVLGSEVYAAPWIPHKSLAGAKGFVMPRHIWAALDCPGAFAVMKNDPGLIVLVRMTAHCITPIQPGRELVVIAWPIQLNGRRSTVGTAVLDESGETLAWARAIWLQPNDWDSGNRGAQQPKKP